VDLKKIKKVKKVKKAKKSKKNKKNKIVNHISNSKKINSINKLNDNSTSLKIINKKQLTNTKYTKPNYNDFELNNLKYNEALKIDKRNYGNYYFSLLRSSHPLITTFYTDNDYNSKTMKICLFSFSFGLYYTTNTLFFIETTIHKVYEDRGVFNFIYQLPQTLYSAMISYIILTIVSSLSLSEKKIIKLKSETKNIEIETLKTIKCLKIKFIFYFICAFLFLLMFWLYSSCFCIVYKNSQIHLLKNALISFGLSLLYPLFIKLLPGLFRIPSIKSPKNKNECLYKIGKLLQLL